MESVAYRVVRIINFLSCTQLGKLVLVFSSIMTNSTNRKYKTNIGINRFILAVISLLRIIMSYELYHKLTQTLIPSILLSIFVTIEGMILYAICKHHLVILYKVVRVLLFSELYLCLKWCWLIFDEATEEAVSRSRSIPIIILAQLLIVALLWAQARMIAASNRNRVAANWASFPMAWIVYYSSIT